MRRAILAATLLALACARPETYRENEEFQYSRSSSDDGKKSGFYGAQRGNVGGNYEKAHNMDSLAQNQMSSVVRQVDGELGSGADTKTGSVFNRGNSKGIYGSGQYDLSNLGGRNFEEGVNYDNSHSSSYSQNSGYRSNTFANNARYRSQQSQSSQQNAGYGAGESVYYMGNQRADDLQRSNNQEYGSQAANSYRYRSQSNSEGSSRYDQSITDSNAASDSTLQSRHVSSPVKFYIRPGTRTTIPLTVQSYDATRLDSSSNAQSEHDEQKYAENGMSSRPKHYESSYSYKKEWEKHDTQPLAIVPTENPFPKHSDLINSQNQQQSGQSYDDNNAFRVYNSNAKYSNSHQSKYQSGYKTGQNVAALSNAQAYTANNEETKNAGEIENLVGDINSKPKSYQSSYSYHKSWERRGDPYVIVPAGDSNSQIAQRLTAASDSFSKQTSHKHNSGYNYAQHGYSEDCDCDENGHVRVARSYNNDQYQRTTQQQSQDLLELGQQQEQQNMWQNLEDLGQQTQNKWDDLENLGQVTQNGWDQSRSLDQQNEFADLKEKQSQNENSNNQLQHNLEDFVQQTENKWNNLEDLSQQSQNKWDNQESLNQQKPNEIDNSANLEQAQKKWDQLEESRQQMDNNHEHLEQIGQESQNQWNNLETLNQQSQDKLDNQDLGQQANNMWPQLENLNQQTQSNWNHGNINQQTQRDLEQQGETFNTNLHDFTQNQQSYGPWDSVLVPNQIIETSVQGETSDNNKNFWDQFDLGNQISSQSNTGPDKPLNMNRSDGDTYFHRQFNTIYQNNDTPNKEGSPLNSLWNKLDNFDEYSHGQTANSYSNNLFNTQEAKKHYHYQHEWTITNNTDKQNVFHSDFNHHEILSDVNMNKNYTKETKYPSEENLEINNTTKLFKTDVAQNNLHPVAEGRGDIDSEDASTESTYIGNPLDKLFEDVPSNTKKDKTSDEIELLSLKKIENDKGEISSIEDSEFKVIGLNQNKHNSNIQNQRNTNTHIIQINTTSTSANTEIHNDRNKLESLSVTSIPQRRENKNVQIQDSNKLVNTQVEIQEQNMDQEFEDINQNKDYNLEEQTLISFNQNKLATSLVSPISQKEEVENVQQLQDSHKLTNTPEKLEQQNINQQFEGVNPNHYHNLEDQTLVNFDQNNIYNKISGLESFQDNAIPQKEGRDNFQQSQDSYNLINVQEQSKHQNMDQQFENINQNIYHDADEQMLIYLDQNIEGGKQFEPTNNFENQYNQEQKLQDLVNFPAANDFQVQKKDDKPQIQNPWGSETNSQEKYNSLKEPEEREVSQKVTKLESVKNDEIQIPIEVTEKPSFWKSVGKKFSNAKESVVSWFRS